MAGARLGRETAALISPEALATIPPDGYSMRQLALEAQRRVLPRVLVADANRADRGVPRVLLLPRALVVTLLVIAGLAPSDGGPATLESPGAGFWTGVACGTAIGTIAVLAISGVGLGIAGVLSVGLGAALLGGGVTAVAGGVVLLWGSGFCLAAAFGH